MAVVYVREQGSMVRKRGGRMLVEKEGETLLEIPLRETDCVAIFGNVQVSTQALSELLDRGIPLALYTRNGRLKGHLAPEMSKNVELRVTQYRVAMDGAASLGIAKAVVAAKVRNGQRVVADYRAHYPSEALAGACAAMERAAEESGSARDVASLMGYEGTAAAAYFGVFGEMNRSGFAFPGRRKHPATDPINALLSLGYTMAMSEIRSLVEGAGMEPHLGFLHRVEYGRPSLALDLLEAFRAPAVDRLTLRLVNEGVLKEEDFGRRAGGAGTGSVILMPEAFRRYLEAYESAVTEARACAAGGFRAAWRADVEGLARALREGGEFRPYREEA